MDKRHAVHVLFETDERRLQFMEWVMAEHDAVGQVRKYSGEPYWVHPIEVANIYTVNLGGKITQLEIEICLGHDLIEDTDVTSDSLYDKCIDLGYTHGQAGIITRGVMDLTDRFTKEDYPGWNRAARKTAEKERIGKTEGNIQSCKMCDNLSNTWSICEHDPGFAKTYVKEVWRGALEMTKANSALSTQLMNLLLVKAANLDIRLEK